MNDFIKGVRTKNGVKKIDYLSLANLPLTVNGQVCCPNDGEAFNVSVADGQACVSGRNWDWGSVSYIPAAVDGVAITRVDNIGNMTQADGAFSHSEGLKTIATGVYSHAEGNSSYAQGDYSHAEGYKSQALGNYSHAAGANSIATADFQTVIGKNNAENADALFIVGNGKYSHSRSNAFEVLPDGIKIGSVTVTEAQLSALLALL